MEKIHAPLSAGEPFDLEDDSPPGGEQRSRVGHMLRVFRGSWKRRVETTHFFDHISGGVSAAKPKALQIHTRKNYIVLESAAKKSLSEENVFLSFFFLSFK